jgi:hypothetical protein
MNARNMKRFGINIDEKRTERQVGYLQEIYREARSTEHKIMLELLKQIRT